MTINKKLVWIFGSLSLITLFTFPHFANAGWAGSGGVPSTVTLTANPISIDSGDSTNVSWSVDIIRPAQSPHNPALGCTKSGAWSGFIADTDGGYSGSYNTGNLTSDKTYNISCLVPGGDGSYMTITDSLTVSVGDAPISNGYCGYYHQRVSAQHPTSGMWDPRISDWSYTSVCDSGSLSNSYPGHTDQGDTWNWSCKPPLGGVTAYCYAYKSENLSVTASANPSSGLAPLNNVAITANVSGSVTGNIQYKLDCTSDGTWEQTVTNTSDPYTFTTKCSYPDSGVYTARVNATRGGLTATTNTLVTVNPRSLSLTASANPNFGPAPLNGVAITANVSGTAIGNIQYKLDCTSDVNSGGVWEQTVTNTSDPYTFTTLCNYPDAGLYTVTVEATRSGVTRTDTTQVTVGEVPKLAIEVRANPSSGNEQLNDVDIIVDIVEKETTVTGPIEYKIYCIEGEVLSHQVNNINTLSYTAEALCDYVTADTYIVLVEATRQGVRATDTANVVVTRVSATCSDGVQNQDETGIDTGGVCGGGGSTETCSDGVQNQDETGIDTGGVCGGGGDPIELTVSCSVDPNPARIGEQVTWTALVTAGGTPPFTYVWSGTNISTPITTDINTLTKVYSTTGEKSINITVRKEEGNTLMAQGSCSTNDNNPQVLRVYVDPDLEEF